MLTVMAPTVSFSLPKSLSKLEIPGAKIEDAKGVIRVMAESNPTINHFLAVWKFSGISASSWLSQPTMPSTRLLIGRGSNGMRSVGFRPLTRLRMRDNLLLTLPRDSIFFNSSMSSV
jgi:hypothetical protein